MKKTKPSENKKSRVIKPGGVPKYIAACPKKSQAGLKALRIAIQAVAPDAVETLSYFNIPGYSFAGHIYNGMFAWFSFKGSSVRLHIRPQAILKYKKELENYITTKAIVSFRIDKAVPQVLVKKLVRASLNDMINAR